MAFSFFKKKAEGSAGDKPKRDPRKGKRFFEHAQAVADARNYDYAIQCYIDGLKHDPDNMIRHEALYDVALKRKVGGGKPPGLTEIIKPASGDYVDKLLNAEYLWAKDPLNLNLMLNVMERAVVADRHEPDLNIGEVAFWVGTKILEGNQSTRTPKPSAMIRLRDLFVELNAYAQAVEACKLAIEFSKSESERDRLVLELKDLDAELTIERSGLDQTNRDFRVSVRNMDQQRALADADAITKTDDIIENNIRNTKAEYDAKPDDLDRLGKYISALLAKETIESENLAIEILNKTFTETSQYRFKMQAGDIRIKQFNRQIKELRRLAETNPDNDEHRQNYIQTRKQQGQFELQEYKERTENYPTDLRLRFEYGKRLFAAKSYDEAISMFQDSQKDPKARVVSMQYLGSCYVAKGWFEEAIETFDRALAAHSSTNDTLALDLMYVKMDALERIARKGKSVEQAKEAQKIASGIIQLNIKFRDIKDRMTKIRELVDDLQKQTT